MLHTNTSLQTVDLASNAIEDEGATALAHAIASNHTLVKLELQRNGISAEGARLIAGALERNTSLQYLGFAFNGFGDSGVQHIATVIAGVNTTLKQLDLGFNGVCLDGARALSHGLRHNHWLETLELGYNGITDAGACELAKAVRCNTVLTALGVPSNGISNEGAAELASALRENNTLIQMGLSANNIGDEGAKHLACVLNINLALETLYLEENDVVEDGEGAQALKHVLSNTFRVRELDDSLQLAFCMGMHSRLGEVLFPAEGPRLQRAQSCTARPAQPSVVWPSSPRCVGFVVCGVLTWAGVPGEQRSAVQLLDDNSAQEVIKHCHQRIRRDIQFYPRS